MKYTIAILTSLTLTMVTSNSIAADWQRFASSDTAFYSIDFDSISTSGLYKKAWVRVNFAKPQETEHYPKKTFQSQVFQYYFDCKGKTLYATRSTLYEKVASGGEVVQSDSEKFDPKYLTEFMPDTIGEIMHTTACGPSSARAKLKSTNEAENREFLKRLAEDEKAL